MRTIGRPGKKKKKKKKKNICTLSSHRATRELYAKVPSHRAPVGTLCKGSMRIELRCERSSMRLYTALRPSIFFYFLIYKKIFKMLESGARNKNKNKNSKIEESKKKKKKKELNNIFFFLNLL